MNLDFLKLLKLNLYAQCFYEPLKCSQIITLGNGSFEKGLYYLLKKTCLELCKLTGEISNGPTEDSVS